MQQLCFILFGWTLGVFSSIILETYKRKQIKEEYKDSVITELKMFFTRLVATYYTMSGGRFI